LPSNTPGVYRGQLAFDFSDGSPTQRVDILFLVVPGPAASGTSGFDQQRLSRRSVPDDSGPRTMATGLEPAVDGCAPQRLHAVYRSISDNFRTPVAWASPVEVLVADDCGGAVTDATVVASFSNGDPPLILQSLGNGLYVGTWRPTTAGEQVLVTVRAEAPPLQGAELRGQGQVQGNPSASAVSSGGIVNAASYAPGEPVTPGGIISVFGLNLAQGQNLATQLPLERSLGGSPNFVGLYQVNVRVPAGVQPGSSVELTLTQNGVPSNTVTIFDTVRKWRSVASARMNRR
jgi:hypothetical protein